MAIDYDTIMNFKIPETRQIVTKQDIAFYALSCGLGADPLDEAQLDFVDPHRPLKMLPSMPVVLAYPGMFLANPALGIDAVKIVHGEQSVEYLAAIPLGCTVVGQSKIVSLIDKGQDRGAIITVAHDIADADTNLIYAKTSAIIFLRGDGGFGGPSGPVPPLHKMPDTAPDIVIDLPTRPEQALYYRLNGDDNPLHADPEFARRAGFPRPILHGLCTFGVVTHALLRGMADYDPTKLAKFGCRFSAPVFPGETITTEIWRDGSFRACVAERDSVVVNHGYFTLRG